MDKWKGGADGRAKRVQRDVPPRAALIMAQWVGALLSRQSHRIDSSLRLFKERAGRIHAQRDAVAVVPDDGCYDVLGLIRSLSPGDEPSAERVEVDPRPPLAINHVIDADRPAVVRGLVRCLERPLANGIGLVRAAAGDDLRQRRMYRTWPACRERTAPHDQAAFHIA